MTMTPEEMRERGRGWASDAPRAIWQAAAVIRQGQLELQQSLDEIKKLLESQRGCILSAPEPTEEDEAHVQKLVEEGRVAPRKIPDVP